MSWNRLLGLALVVALGAACNVSPIPLPLPYADSGAAMDGSTTPGKDAGVDLPQLPDLGMVKDSAVQDAPGPKPDLVGTPDCGAPDGNVTDGGAPIQDGGATTDGGPTTDGVGPTTDGGAPTTDGVAPTDGGPTTDGVGPTTDGGAPTTDGVAPTTDGGPIIDGGPTEGGPEESSFPKCG